MLTRSTVHSILNAKPPAAPVVAEPVIVKSSSVPVIAISNIKDKASILSSVAAAGVNKSKSKPLVLDDNMGIVISSGGKNGTSNDKPLGTNSLTHSLPYSLNSLLTHSLAYAGYNGGPVHGQVISDNATIVTRGRAHSPIQISPERSNNIRIDPAKRKDLASYINMPGSAPGSPPPAPPLSNSMEFDSIHSNHAAVAVPSRVDKDMPIRVVVRKRPLSKVEISKGDKDVLEIQSHGVVLVHEPKVKVDLTKIIETQEFVFDDSFEMNETNQQIYNRTIKNLVSFVFDYGKASCFAYGQTGSGKTFTMMGSSPENPLGSLDDSSENVGLYVLAAKDIFKLLALPKYERLQVTVSCFEIYGGKLFDLLNERSIVKCLEDAKQQVQLPGLTEHPVKSTQELLLLMAKAHTQRSTGSTGANETSSRSHQVMQISVKEPPAPVETNRRKGSISFHAGPPAAAIGGKLSFIDLAGSEKGSDAANSSKQTRLEGAEINTSLLALKEVIRSLERKNGYTPFRGSKLTQVLKDSFVGEKTRTCMIACVSPSSTNCEHTLNTLRYADRVKEHQGSNNNNNNGNAVSSPPAINFPGSSPVTADALSKQMNGLHIGGPPTGMNPASLVAAPKAVSANVVSKNISKPPLPVSSNERKASNMEGKNIHRSPTRDVKKAKPVESPLYDQLEQPNTADKLSYTDLINRSVELLTAHRSSIAEMVEVMKDEMELVQCMENTEDRDVEVYINRLDNILDLKMEGNHSPTHPLSHSSLTYLFKVLMHLKVN